MLRKKRLNESSFVFLSDLEQLNIYFALGSETGRALKARFLRNYLEVNLKLVLFQAYQQQME